MIPKVDYQIHDLLVRVFLPPPLDGDDTEFRQLSERLINSFEKLEFNVLTLIEKYSGFEWRFEKIPVYLIPDSRILKSFAKSNLENKRPGVVLKVMDNLTRNIHIFIHELAHINQNQGEFSKTSFALNPDGSRNHPNYELAADIVTLYILRDLFGSNSEYEKDMMEFLTTTDMVNKDKYDALMEKVDIWDLSKKTLREYIE